MTLPYETRPTLVFRAKRLIPSSFIDAMIITIAAMAISLALFGLFLVCTSRINPFDVYAVMFHGAFGTSYAWRVSLIHAAPLLLTALCVAPAGTRWNDHHRRRRVRAAGGPGGSGGGSRHAAFDAAGGPDRNDPAGHVDRRPVDRGGGGCGNIAA